MDPAEIKMQGDNADGYDDDVWVDDDACATFEDVDGAADVAAARRQCSPQPVRLKLIPD